jgi:hypothetical protein
VVQSRKCIKPDQAAEQIVFSYIDFPYQNSYQSRHAQEELSFHREAGKSRKLAVYYDMISAEL